jgi:hypothetical protein
MIPIAIDFGNGELVLPDGARIGKGAAPEQVRAALSAQGVEPRIEEGPLGEIVWAQGEIMTRRVDVGLRFRVGSLASVRILGADGAGEHEIARTLRDRAWLASFLGPPGYENPRGAVYAYPWGWVHAICGEVSLTYPGHRMPVPLPGRGSSEGESFRCCGCGHVMDLGYGRGVLEAGRDRGGAPCEACGAVAWVQAGSMTEFYRFSQRADVCEVGRHPADGIKSYSLVSRAGPAPPGMIRLDRLTIKACPAHVDELRRGFLGCYLEDG